MTDHPRKPGYLWVPAWREYESALEHAAKRTGDEEGAQNGAAITRRVLGDFWDRHVRRRDEEETFCTYLQSNLRHAAGIARVSAAWSLTSDPKGQPGGKSASDKADELLASWLRAAADDIRGSL